MKSTDKPMLNQKEPEEPMPVLNFKSDFLHSSSGQWAPRFLLMMKHQFFRWELALVMVSSWFSAPSL